MNKAQQQAALLLTNRAERFNRTLDGKKTMNGVLTWRTLDWSGDVFVIDGSNINDEHKWYETHIHIIAEIGPRGGVKLRHCEGMKASLLK